SRTPKSTRRWESSARRWRPRPASRAGQSGGLTRSVVDSSFLVSGSFATIERMSERLVWDAVESAAAAVDSLVSVDLGVVEAVLGFGDVVEEVARKLAVVQQAVAAWVDDVQVLRLRWRLSPGEAKARLRR